MLLLEILFWLFLFIIFYSYVGYGLLIWLLVMVKRTFIRKRTNYPSNDSLPEVTLIIAAYNEENFILDKIHNTLALHYPTGKLQIIFVTDGSTDRTPEIARDFEKITVMHSLERKGKVAAINRVMGFVKTPVVIFSDANTLLNQESLLNIARHYSDSRIGGVAGEKKIITGIKEKAAGAGEGLYWKYESFLKKMDSEFYSVVGAAGELFSLRTELYEHVNDNVLLDDFIISLRICQKGWKVKYEPDAFAMETPSASLKEEQKRKIRISAGGFQSIWMLRDLLNVFKYPVLSFQYISHRVLRWAVCPFLLPLILIINILLLNYQVHPVYTIMLCCQALFYGMAALGWMLAEKNIKSKILYIPYYFLFINISLYKGLQRYLNGRQTVLWDKAARQDIQKVSR